MHLLYRWVDEHRGWRATTLEKERDIISSFHDFEKAKKLLVSREIILCGVKLLRLYDGVK